MRYKLAICVAGALGCFGVAEAQSPVPNPPTPPAAQDRTTIKAGDPGPTDPATGMSKRENYDAQLNSGATDNSTGTPTGADEQKAR